MTIEYNQEKEDIQLLFKHLDEMYGAEKAQELILTHRNNLFGYHGLAWATGKRNLTYFCLHFLSNVYLAEDNAEIAPIHFQMWHEINNMILNKSHDKQTYILPRGTGKSLFGSLATAIWASLYEHKKYTVIASAIGDTAETFIKNIKMAVDGNSKIEDAFGKIYDTRKFINNSEKVEFANKTLIQSISASSTLRGKSYNNKRIELLLLDDYQKDDEVATEDQRNKKWKRFSDDVNYAMQKNNSTMIAVGTIQHKECFYSRLIKSATWKNRQAKGILVDDVDELFNSGGHWLEFKKLLTDRDNEHRLDYAKEYYLQNEEEMQYPLLWQSYWSCLDIALAYYENPISFKQEMQGDVDSIGQKRFKTIITQSAGEIESHNFDKTMLVVDPAGSGTKGKRDYYAFVVGSTVTDSKVKYIRKGEIFRFDFDEYLEKILSYLRAYTDITHVFIEKQTYSGADLIRLRELIKEDKELSSRGIIFINEQQRMNKDAKINLIVPDVNMGRIIFNEDDKEALEQLSDFAGVNYSLHDDFPDVVSQFSLEIDKLNKQAGKIRFFDVRF